MKRKIKLTDPQFAFLGRLVTEPLEATVDYPPARKLVEFGFATRCTHTSEINGRRNPHFYAITDAGRAHHRVIYMADRKCPQCKTAPWTCRVCSRKTCEHHCSKKKNDGTALCGRRECHSQPLPPKAEPKTAKVGGGRPSCAAGCACPSWEEPG